MGNYDFNLAWYTLSFLYMWIYIFIMEKLHPSYLYFNIVSPPSSLFSSSMTLFICMLCLCIRFFRSLLYSIIFCILEWWYKNFPPAQQNLAFPGWCPKSLDHFVYLLRIQQWTRNDGLSTIYFCKVGETFNYLVFYTSKAKNNSRYKENLFSKT